MGALCLPPLRRRDVTRFKGFENAVEEVLVTDQRVCPSEVAWAEVPTIAAMAAAARMTTVIPARMGRGSGSVLPMSIHWEPRLELGDIGLDPA
jgi:hypothetical protein